MGNSDTNWDVEEVLEVAEEDGDIQVLVKWKNFKEKSNSWVFLKDSNLNAHDVLMTL